MLLAGSKQLHPEAFVILFVCFPPQISIHKCFHRSDQASLKILQLLLPVTESEKRSEKHKEPSSFWCLSEKEWEIEENRQIGRAHV